MLWHPSEDRIKKTRLYHFIRQVDKHYPLTSLDYATLHQFSVRKTKRFWKMLLQYYGVKYFGDLEPVCTNVGFDSYGWFPNVRLNFTENIFLYGEGYKVAIKSLLESGDKEEYTYTQLKNIVANVQTALTPTLKAGDVLASYMPNVAEPVIAMLACAGLGGVTTAISATNTVEYAVKCFSQSNPKVLVACAGYEYNGEYIDTCEQVRQIAAQVASIETVVVVDRYQKRPDITDIQNAILWHAFIDVKSSALQFVARNFSDPLCLTYASRPSGSVACIAQSVGGVLLQHLKEVGLHLDHGAEKNMLLATACGDMMWGWQVTGLFFGGTVTLYDGSLFHPYAESFWEKVSNEKVNIVGVPTCYMAQLSEQGRGFARVNLFNLDSIVSAGTPLLPKQYEFVYQSIKRDVHLASISGAASIAGCLFSSNPMGAVVRGEMPCKALAMDVYCYDGDDKHAEEQGGQMVCKKSFPSQPLYCVEGTHKKPLGAVIAMESLTGWRGFEGNAQNAAQEDDNESRTHTFGKELCS